MEGVRGKTVRRHIQSERAKFLLLDDSSHNGGAMMRARHILREYHHTYATGGSNAWDFVMDCIDDECVMRMYQEQENGVVECQAVADSVQCNPLRAAFTLSCDQCCGGASLSVTVEEVDSGVG